MMAKIDDSLLISVALLDRVVPQLKTDSREQLNRTSLNTIKQSVSHAVQKIISSGVSGIYTTGYLVGTVECIDTLLSDPNFVETDVYTKDIIASKILDALENLYIEAGKFYTENEFNYTARLEPLLNKIIDRCLQKGYYFGEDVG